VAVKTDVKTGHDTAYVTRGHAAGCAGAMAYYTRTGDPPGTWEGRGCAALDVSGTVQAEVAERLYQQGMGPGGERIIQHAAPKDDEDQAAAEAAAIARYREGHPFASASEINAERTRIRAMSPGISRPYYDVTSSASKSVSVLHASLRVAAAHARQAGDHAKAAALDGEAQAIEEALLESVREGLELLQAMACYVRTGHHSKDTGSGGTGKASSRPRGCTRSAGTGIPSCTSTWRSSTPSSAPTGPTTSGAPLTGSTSTSSATCTASPLTGRSSSGCWTWATPWPGAPTGTAPKSAASPSRSWTSSPPGPGPSTASSARGPTSTRPSTASRPAGARST
jgi:TrwC relaxase